MIEAKVFCDQLRKMYYSSDSCERTIIDAIERSIEDIGSQKKICGLPRKTSSYRIGILIERKLDVF